MQNMIAIDLQIPHMATAPRARDAEYDNKNYKKKIF